MSESEGMEKKLRERMEQLRSRDKLYEFSFAGMEYKNSIRT